MGHLKKFVIVPFLFCFSLCFFGGLVYGLTKFRSKTSDSGEKGSSFIFKYTQVNRLKNESNTGFVTKLSPIEKTGMFYAESTQDQKFVLISEFGQNEYQCFGSCVCLSESDDRKSIIASTLSRNAFYMVSAISSIVAFQKAKEYFSNECVEKLSDTCSLSSIQSETETCETINKINEEESESQTSSSNLRKYICKGKCIERIFQRKEAKTLASQYGCEELKKEEEVVIYPSQLPENQRKRVYEYAKVKFVKDVLSPYCKQESGVLVKYSRQDRRALPSRNVFLCKGQRQKEIHCLQTYPVPWKRNKK